MTTAGMLVAHYHFDPWEKSIPAWGLQYLHLSWCRGAPVCAPSSMEYPNQGRHTGLPLRLSFRSLALIFLAAICCAAPFLYICYLVNKYAVNVPFWDDWARIQIITMITNFDKNR
ncbi:MAG: hypothetical protein NTY51_07860 [Deltaproteobacteria bacterium]|nr:hypothetical protein [Deltaproteobacteria bacterium]